MSGVAAAAPARAAMPAHGAPGVLSPMGAASLLPQPAPPTGELSDPLAQIYAVLARQGDDQIRMGTADVKARSEKVKEALKDEEAARRRASEERDAQHGPWATLKSVATVVAEVAGVVVSVAGIVMTGGAAAPIVVAVAALVLSTGGAVVAKTGVLGKSSAGVGLGMEVAGVAVGGTSALAGIGTTAKTATETVKVASTVKTASSVTQAAGTATGATAGIAVSSFESAALGADADQAEAQTTRAMAERQVRALLEWMKGIQESNQDALGTIQSTKEASARTAQSLATLGARA